MTYIKWNKVLLNHFFNPDKGKNEIVLYADKTLINSIGKENNLGGYDDFLKCIMIDYEDRILLYDELLSASGQRRTVEINRELKKIILEFPNTLREIHSNRHQILYFNYLIFYISAYIGNDNTSYYRFLNGIVKKYLPKHKNKNALSGLDCLFNDLEEWSLKNENGFFRARRIGNLTYKGLLNYQVVLNPKENNDFEELLFVHGIQVDDNTIYPELLNRVLPHAVNSRLRAKLIKGVKQPVYAEWFLNKSLQFDHSVFAKTVRGGEIDVFRKGTLIFNINKDYKLELLSDTLLNENDVPLGFTLQESNKNRFGYYETAVEADETVEFREYRLTTADKRLELKTPPLNNVTFFQKNGDEYLQTNHPDISYEGIVLVRGEQIKWANWSNNDKHLKSCERINSYILNQLFGADYLFFKVTGVKKSYYKNSNEVFYTSNHNEGLVVKKLGGLRVGKYCYLDIGLPYFEILDDFFIDGTDWRTKVFRNGAEDRDIEKQRVNNRLYLTINGKTTIDEATLVTIKFTKGKFERSFDFSIIGTKVKCLPSNQLFKFDKWGDSIENGSVFLKGNQLVGGSKIALNNNRHLLEKAKEDYSFDRNYFMYLIMGLAAHSSRDYLQYREIIKAIDSCLTYQRSKGVEIKENNYSKFNLINNLIGLGYLNYKQKETFEKQYQIMPYALSKIEKSFDSTTQVFQLTGFLSLLMMNRITEFCERHNIKIRYKRPDWLEGSSLESMLLPDLIYLDLKHKQKAFTQFISESFQTEIVVEDLYHPGDSLLQFVASLSDFEQVHLTQKINLENQKLSADDIDDFPRIARTAKDYQRFGKYYYKEFLEKSEGNYYRVEHKYWTNLFIGQKKEQPILFMKRTFGQERFNYSREVLIPSKITLPEIAYKSLCLLNHGIPSTRKVFFKNFHSKSRPIKNKTFRHFDIYHISNKDESRRKNIARILTGIDDLDDNPQIKYFNNNSSSKYQMFYTKCSVFSDVKFLITIEDSKDKLVALYFYKNLYLKRNTNDDVNSITITIDSIESTFIKIDSKELNENELLSLMLDGKTHDFSICKTGKSYNLEILEKENVLIRELY